MPEQVTITVAVGLALWAGVTTLSLARLLRVPPLLFYVAAGLLLGPMGLGWLDPRALGSGLPILAEFGLAVILFEGALNLPISLRSALPNASRRMLGLAMPMTGALAAVLGHYVAGLGWMPAVVFGALIVVTGPTTIGPLLRSITLGRKLETLLRHEAIWGDCLGILLASAVLPFWIGEDGGSSLGALPVRLLEKASLAVGLGILLGIVLGRIVLPLLARIGDPELPGMVALGWAILAFVVGQAVSPGSGPIASAVAGFTLRTLKTPQVREIRHFKGQVAHLFIAMLFVLLSALFDVSDLKGNMAGLLLTAFLLGAAARPLSVGVALAGTDLSWRERVYAALIGPRGIIALATAAYAVTQRPNDPMAHGVFTLTFLIIAFSSAFATLAGRPLAWALRVQVAESRTGVVLVGIHDFSKALAGALAPHVPVRLIDSDPAKVAGLSVPGAEAAVGNALDESLFEDALEVGFRRLVAMTPNDGLNKAVVEHAEPVFGATRVFRVPVFPDREHHEKHRRTTVTAFGADFSMGSLGPPGSWRIRETPTLGRGQVALVSLARGGAMILRADGERPAPYLVLERTGDGDGRAQEVNGREG